MIGGEPSRPRLGDDTPLAALLRRRIAAEGPISFRDFMEVALYHPEHGYYSTLRGFGAEGDFATSPEVHPVFGTLLGRQALDVWQALGRPAPFRVLELGGGSGALAASLVRSVAAEAPRLWAALRYWIEERSPSLRLAQRERLGGLPVDWGRPPEPPHLVLANELLDAWPVYRVTVRDGRLRELRVGLAEDGFGWVEAETAPPEVLAHFEALRLLPPEGAVTEVNPGLAAWARELAGLLDSPGLALVLDYGYTAEAYYRRPQGTLLTYYRHTQGSDPFVRVGRQDISAHVDFTTLATAAHRAGLQLLGVAAQRALLAHLGLAQFEARLAEPRDRAALAALRDPKSLGSIGALFLGRGLGGYRPAGLRPGRVWPEPGWLPRLPPAPPPDDFLAQWQEAFGR